MDELDEFRTTTLARQMEAEEAFVHGSWVASRFSDVSDFRFADDPQRDG